MPKTVLGHADTYYAHAFGQNKPKCKARQLSCGKAIARLLTGAATPQLGLFWPNPKGCGSCGTSFLFGKFSFFCFADTSLHLCRKKSKISSKIPAAHVRNTCRHALISDFDGTITKEDFFNMVVDRLLTKEDIKPWDDYIAGRISHVEALSRIFAKVRIPQAKLDDFIQSIEIDPKAPETFELCKKLDIPIYICSAGMDYYILKRIPELIKKYNITIVSNTGKYSQETGFKMSPPPAGSPFCCKNTGIAKDKLVNYLKNQGYFTIFAGDGRPDIKAAKAADAVFAKDILLKLCKEQNIETLKFDGFEDIEKYIKQLTKYN